MKTKLEIKFHTWFDRTILADLSNIVAKHNAGLSNTDLSVLEGYYKGYCARWSYSGNTSLNDNELTLIMEEKPFITIIENILIGELKEENNTITEPKSY